MITRFLFSNWVSLSSVMRLKYVCIFSHTEQQASSAPCLHLSHRCVLQCHQEWDGQHCVPGTQDSTRLPAQVLGGQQGKVKVKTGLNGLKVKKIRLKQDRWGFKNFYLVEGLSL